MLNLLFCAIIKKTLRRSTIASGVHHCYHFSQRGNVTYMKKTVFIPLLCLLLCLAAQIATAQTTTAALTGRGADSWGAAVANVKVVATNTATNVSVETITNTTGIYHLPFLPVGSYSVSAEDAGFKKTVIGPFTLEVNQTARVDVVLQLGQGTETVEGRDFAPVLQTESTQTGDVLSSKRITSIPLNGRNFASLTMLIPGAISTAPNAMNTS